MVPVPTDWPYAPLPRITWIELTSRCPLRCSFCSREMLRGRGSDMHFELLRGIISQMGKPEIVRLNYSGESIHYSHLAEAIQLCKRAGASTELVTALSTASPATVRTLVDAGLDRLTVSLHSLDRHRYRQIYGADRLPQLRANIQELLAHRRASGKANPVIDFSFVAMADNLDQLTPLAAFAAEAGSKSICIHPVIRRDLIHQEFPRELTAAGTLRPAFIEQLRAAVHEARRLTPEVAIDVARPEVLAGAGGARDTIPTCDQNPWETVHILSNGDVVPCEVQERVVMGNLSQQDLRTIWTGTRYAEFRARYAAKQLPACNTCPWRRSLARPAQAPGQPAETLYLMWGWYAPEGEQIQWGQRRSLLLITGGQGKLVTIRGALPPASTTGKPARMLLLLDGNAAQTVENASDGVRFVDLTLPLPHSRTVVEFSMEAPYCPAEAGAGRDQRYLGFGFIDAKFSYPHMDPKPGSPPNSAVRSRDAALRAWLAAVTSLDALARIVRKLHPLRTLPLPPSGFDRGVSVMIPERGSPGLLRECLAAVRAAAARAAEPVQIIVVVNGSPADDYKVLRETYREASFQFHREPLGFSRAVLVGAAAAVYGWTYLLNSDVVLEEDALAQVLKLRRPDVFSIGSQLFPYEAAALRTETNLTAFQYAGGMVQANELEPGLDTAARPCAYSGGGSSLFQTRLLRILARKSSCYEPFYWEDIEWGVAARRNGYVNLFCPISRVRHRHRATIARFYAPDQVSRVLERNQFLFQVRNAPSVVNKSALRFHLRGLPGATVRELARPGLVLETMKTRFAAICAPSHDTPALGL